MAACFACSKVRARAACGCCLPASACASCSRCLPAASAPLCCLLPFRLCACQRLLRVLVARALRPLLLRARAACRPCSRVLRAAPACASRVPVLRAVPACASCPALLCAGSACGLCVRVLLALKRRGRWVLPALPWPGLGVCCGVVLWLACVVVFASVRLGRVRRSAPGFAPRPFRASPRGGFGVVSPGPALGRRPGVLWGSAGVYGWQCGCVSLPGVALAWSAVGFGRLVRVVVSPQLFVADLL